MPEKNKDKKVVCPYCKKEINTLLNHQDVVATYTMYKDGSYDKGIIDNNYDSGEDLNIWSCPECNAEITDNEEDAIAFLNGKKIKYVKE
ncbi:MAG: hypothetical protein QXU98_03525 [Candidatus Parvarchaeota archaeon]